MSIWWWAVILFFVDFIVDFAWTMYISAVADKRYLKAAGWSAFISMCGGFTVISYTENHLLLIPAVAGGALGTYCSKYINK